MISSAIFQIEGQATLKGDEVLLRQAFINLIQNAAEAMPQGGTLTIKESASIGSGGDFLDLSLSEYRSCIFRKT